MCINRLPKNPSHMVCVVIPAKAGIQFTVDGLDPDFRRGDVLELLKDFFGSLLIHSHYYNRESLI